MSLEDLDSVLDQAVRAYMVAKKRSLLQRPRHPSEDFDVEKGMTVQDLAPQHPDYYILWGTEPKIKFVGISAAEVLENVCVDNTDDAVVLDNLPVFVVLFFVDTRGILS